MNYGFERCDKSNFVGNDIINYIILSMQLVNVHMLEYNQWVALIVIF